MKYASLIWRSLLNLLRAIIVKASGQTCRVPVSPDALTIIARGKFRRDLQIKEAYFISLQKPKINVRYEKLKRNPETANF